MEFVGTSTYIVLWSLVILQLLLIVGVLTSDNSPAVSLPPLAKGARAPNVSGLDLRTEMTIDVLARLRGTGGVLVLLSGKCPTCLRLAAQIGKLPVEAARRVIAISIGAKDEQSALLERLSIHTPLVIETDISIQTRYRLPEPPSAVVLDPATRIVEYATPRTVDDLAALLVRAENLVIEATIKSQVRTA